MTEAANLARALSAPELSTRRRAKVTAVNAGPPKTLTVSVAGTSMSLRYVEGVTYAVNDQVIVDTRDADWIVLGRLA
jgi:hypothetical protein